MAVWTEKQERASDIERQQAYERGTGGYGGEDQDREELKQIVMPGMPS